ncbi:MAG TPA: CoA ester lyase [Acidimicrobiales bacterium]
MPATTNEDRRRARPRRSMLALPGSNQRFVEKSTTLPADALLIDLEDAVAANAKALAREVTSRALASLDFADRVVTVRVNAWSSGLTIGDLIAIVTSSATRLDAIALPKTNSAAEVVALDLVLHDLEFAAGLTIGSIGIDVLIESALGLANVDEICMASARVDSVALGRADLSASLGMPALVGGADVSAYGGDHFHFILSKVLLAARVAGILALDGPYLRLDDDAGLRALATRAAVLGFDGKWAIHPDQVAILNEVFTPSREDVARAEAILGTLDDAATDKALGALRDGGEMLDEASRKMALAVLGRARGYREVEA